MSTLPLKPLHNCMLHASSFLQSSVLCVAPPHCGTSIRVFTGRIPRPPYPPTGRLTPSTATPYWPFDPVDRRLSLAKKTFIITESYNIEDFEVSRYEIDCADSVLKLKGQSNFRDWETALFLALTANNRYYVRMLSYGIPILSPPEYANTLQEEVKQLLLSDA
ncbi:hypothetical protein AAEP93_000795 [Penicillium crustosum]